MLRQVKGFSGYKVSDRGSVWSLRDSGASAQYRRMTPSKMKSGYLSVRLYDGTGHARKRYVHRLVLEAFVGKPVSGQQGRHLDGNPRNNRLSNLAWGTRKENEADKVRHGKSNRGERNGMAKLSWQDVCDIRSRYMAGGVTMQSLADQYCISNSRISHIVNWKAYISPNPKPPLKT